MKVDFKDITEIVDLENGFFLFQNDVGFFLAINCGSGDITEYPIDKTTYDCVKRREGKVKR